MITIGDVYRIRMDQSDGIKPKGNDLFRYKYIIIIGYDGRNYYGAVTTNTKDHHLVPFEFQYPLKLQEYNCFANCYQLYQVSSTRLTSDCCKGKITDDDLELIIGCVKNSPIIHKNLLKRYDITE